MHVGKEYTLAVQEPGQWLKVACPRAGVVTAGHDPINIVVSDHQRASAFVRFEVRDANGKPKKATFRIGDGERLATPGTTMPAAMRDGNATRLGPLAPKTYRLYVYPMDGSFPVFETPDFELQLRQELDLGVVRVPAHGWVDYRFRATGRVDFSTVTVEFQDKNGVMEGGLLHLDAGGAGRWPLLPGRYRLIVFGEEVATMERALVVEAGKATRLSGELSRGTMVTLKVALPTGEKHLQCTVSDKHGVCCAWEARPERSWTMEYRVVLPHGWLTVEATGSSGKTYMQRFEVTGEAKQVIDLGFRDR